VKENANYHFFFDEAPYGKKSGLIIEELQNLSNMVSRDCFLWIAFQSDTTPNKKSLEKNSEKFVFLVGVNEQTYCIKR
jgi:hypothetical protein